MLTYKKARMLTFVFIFSFFTSYTQVQERILCTIYGDFTIYEPVLLELLECPTVLRLQGIHQYGISYYAKAKHEYNRYIHSIGVLVLLRRFQRPLLEQIAGLLHDVSHTVFSHVGDFLFKHYDTHNSYQDDIHEWFLEQTEIPNILHKYDIAIKDILHKKGHFTALEQDLPDVCADRLEYILYGGLLEHYISDTDIQIILNDITFEDNKWIFKHAPIAQKYALISLYLTEHNFGAPWNIVIYEWMGEVLRRALSINLVTHKEIHFSIDDTVMNKLRQSDDPIIRDLLYKIFDHEHHFTVSTSRAYTLHAKPKFRGINPWVKTMTGPQRLTTQDTAFKKEFKRVKQLMQQGWYIQLQNATEQVI